MWYAIQTDFNKEDATRKFLLNLDGVREVYLPLYRKTLTSANGEKRHHFVPTISGFMFAFIDDDKVSSLITSWGYFTHTFKSFNPETKGKEDKNMVTRAHLLCHRPSDISKEDIIAGARVPQKDIERLRIFNDRHVEGIEDLRILDVSFETLVAENDTVLITEGPYLGIEGIIKQVKSHGKKDRRLHFNIGNWTVSLPNVRNYRHIVIREACRGEKARTVNAWRHVDRLIGSIQSRLSTDNASQKLREILSGLNRNQTIEQYAETLAEGSQMRNFVETLCPKDAGCLISLSRYFQTYDRTIEAGLKDLIPDIKLRAFLTPTSGMETLDDGCRSISSNGRDYFILRHKDFTEVVMRTDLRKYFSPKTCDNDFVYYAHVALIPEKGGVTAAVSWGDFVKQYLLKPEFERIEFTLDLKAKGYGNLLALLETGKIYNKGGIAGFAKRIETSALPADSDPMADERISSAVNDLISDCAPAAVELWQGTRLLFWRKLVQQHVLLHKAALEEQEGD